MPGQWLLHAAAGFDESPDFALPSPPWPLSVSSGTRHCPPARVCMADRLCRKPISLISHSDVRYRGILAGIDPVASTIQLSNGECRTRSTSFSVQLTTYGKCTLWARSREGEQTFLRGPLHGMKLITDVKELRLTCPRAHKHHVDSSVAFLLISVMSSSRVLGDAY